MSEPVPGTPADPGIDVRCQVCGELAGDAVVRCPVCDTPHHADCWDYAGACTTFGCSGAPAGAPPPSRVASFVARRRAAAAKTYQRYLDTTRGLRLLRVGRFVSLLAMGVGACSLPATSWLLPATRPAHVLSGKGWRTVTCSLDGDVMAAGDSAHGVHLLGPRRLEAREVLRAPRPVVQRLAFDRTGHTLAALSVDDPIYGHSDVSLTVFHRGGAHAVTANLPASLAALSEPSGHPDAYDRRLAKHLDQVAVSPDGNYVAALTQTGTAACWNSRNGTLRWLREGATGRFPHALAFTADGAQLVVPGPRFLDADTGEPVSGSPPVRETTGQNTAHAIAADGSLLLWRLAWGWSVRRLAPDGRVLAESPEVQEEHGYLSMALSPWGGRCAMTQDEEVRVYDLPSGRLVHRVGGFSHGARSLAFTAHGTRLVAVDWKGRELYLWHLGTLALGTFGPWIAPLAWLLVGLIGWVACRDLARWLVRQVPR